MINQLKKYLTIPTLLLIGLLLFSGVVRITNLNYNSPFLDEASYIVHGQHIIQGQGETGFGFDWIGGMPLVYPVLSAIFYGFGGIIGTRLVNIFFAIVSIYLYYRISKKIIFFADKRLNCINGIIATFFLSLIPIHISLSRLAIYDMPAFGFFLLAIVFLQEAIIYKEPKKYHFAGTAFLIAVIIKYSILLVLPLLAAVALTYVWLYQKDQLNNLMALLVNVIIGIFIYISVLYSDLKALFLNRLIDTGEMSDAIVGQFIDLTGIWYLFAAVAAVWLLSQRRFSAVIIVLISFWHLLMHLVFKNTVAVQQDAMFSLIFILPLAAAFFTKLIKKTWSTGICILVITAVIVFVSYTLPKTYTLEHFWPNTAKAMSFLTNMASANDKILAQSGAVATLALGQRLNQENIIGPFAFSYKDKQGDQAYQDAVADRYFDYIELDFTTTDLSGKIEAQIRENYQLIFDQDSVVIYQVK